jgi:Icc protein
MTLRVVGDAAAPVFLVPFLGTTVMQELWVHRIFVEGLPPTLDALFVTSDLQGWARRPDGPRLLGFAVADELLDHCRASGLDPRRIGVLLAGDLYRARGSAAREVASATCARSGARSRRRSGSWPGSPATTTRSARAPATCCAFAQEEGIHLLDSGTEGLLPGAECLGLRLAGVSGIVGNPIRPWRKTREEMTAALARVAQLGADVLLLHQNPSLPDVRRSDHLWLTELLHAHGTAACGCSGIRSATGR